jgi:hypothetical protein
MFDAFAWKSYGRRAQRIASMLAVAVPLALLTSGATRAAEERPVESKSNGATMKIRLTVNGKQISATLAANATAKDFRSLLPLTMTFDDYASIEKIAYPPRKLSTAGAPAGNDPSVGDIMYYAPWGNIAIYYHDAPYASGLVLLARIDSGVEAFAASGPMKITIDGVDNR